MMNHEKKLAKENPHHSDHHSDHHTDHHVHLRKSTTATAHPHSKLKLSRDGSLPKISVDSPKLHKHPIGQKIENNADEEKSKTMLWALLASYLPDDKISLQREFVRHVEYTLAQTRSEANNFSGFEALALCSKDRLIERWKDTMLYFKQNGVKQVNYLSLEFLLGRSLQNSLVALGLTGKYTDALMELGFQLEDLYDEEHDAGLGNGGLGRLAACFMDSLATMDYPACGYGLRYTYGMFYQDLQDGEQVELPDYWLNYGSPWEIERLDISHSVGFGGVVEEEVINGVKQIVWQPAEKIVAIAYDYPIPGFNTFNTINIRLWSSKPSDEFDLESFNKGDYLGSIEEKQRCENITNVLYPNDNTMQGKELRLKQQYFFVCATLQDIIGQFKDSGKDFSEFPKMHAIQLNDTHPTLGIPELMRILLDQEHMSWEQAWDITTKTFSYTNHTVLPEALERWSVSMVEHILPRHIRIIYEINERFLQLVNKRWPGDIDRRRALSIIDESGGRTIRMAYLAIVGSHTINGVAALHSELIKHDVFSHFYELWPEKFQNKTNGVTPRRWIHQCNPSLSYFITKTLNTSRWVVNLDIIKKLRDHADDTTFQNQWMAIKRENKIRMAKYIEKVCDGLVVNVDAMFDVQVKRFHEYKRQLLNILGVIHRYLEIKSGKSKTPKVVIFGGKAAPGYYMAKLIIKLINSVARVINNDPMVGNMLKVVFIPNYCVSNAEVIIPSSDISEHISTAGTEASGTSNMKFAMNGGLIIGTLDGANIEIRDAIGEENMFIFGALTADIGKIKKQIHEGTFAPDRRWTQVITAIEEGRFGPARDFKPILDSITAGNDHYILSYDFASYLEAHEKIDLAYQNQSKWAKMSIHSTAGCGMFSSDRTIKEYAKDIWHIEQCRRPGPIPISTEEVKTITKSPVGSPFDSLNNPMISMERLTPTGTGHSKHLSTGGPSSLRVAMDPKQTTKGFSVSKDHK